MSECIADVDTYKNLRQRVVSTKKAVVVVFFFTYVVYCVTLGLKNCLKGSKPNEDGTPSNYMLWQRRAEKFSKDILARNYMVLMAFLLSAQILPTAWTAFLAYAYLVALGVNGVGVFMGESVPALARLRWVGLLVSSFIGYLTVWTMVGGKWCGLFYFSKFFSADFYE